MRNPERIEPLLNEFKELWLQYPDLRFGQLVTIIYRKSNCIDPFFPEDDKWLEWIRLIRNEKQ